MMPATRIVCRVVEICCFRFRNSLPEYLLLQRSPRDEIYPNLWQLVSGTIGDGESALAAAQREFREETGLVPVHFWTAPYVSSFYDHTDDAVNLCPFFVAQVQPSSVPTLSPEHQLFEWLPRDAARRKLVWPGQRQGLDVVNDYVVSGEWAGLLTRITPKQ